MFAAESITYREREVKQIGLLAGGTGIGEICEL
jgi:NAD(P)H-flavin reductase